MPEVFLRKNPAFEEAQCGKQPRYFFEVRLPGILPNGEPLWIPVFWRLNPFSHILLKEIYTVEIAGAPIQKANLNALREDTLKAVLSLLRNSRLPRYAFVFNERRDMIFVYVAGRHLKARSATGPEFSAEDLGQLSRRLCDYLASAKRVQSGDEPSPHLLSWHDLRLYPPAFVVCGEPDLYLPVFFEPNAGRGKLTLEYDETEFYETTGDKPEAEALLRIFEKVAHYLRSARRIADATDLCIELPDPRMWEETLVDARYRLAYRDTSNGSIVKVQMPVTRKNGYLIAHHGNGTGGSTLFLSRELEDLKSRVGSRLQKKRVITHPEELVLEEGNHTHGHPTM